MKAEAIYVVVTPTGRVHERAAFDMGVATRAYVRSWLPDEVSVNDYVADQLWRAFAQSKYSVHKIDMPDNLEGKEVCRT